MLYDPEQRPPLSLLAQTLDKYFETIQTNQLEIISMLVSAIIEDV